MREQICDVNKLSDPKPATLIDWGLTALSVQIGYIVSLISYVAV